VVDVLPDLALVAHHADHRVGDAGVLRRLALVRPAADFAILAAHRRGRAIGAQVRFLASVLAGHDLVGFAGAAVEVENELEAGSQSALPVAGHAWPLIPDVPRKAPPALLTHPGQPAVPIRDDFVVAVDQPEVDQHLSVAAIGSCANTPRIRPSQSAMPPEV
jgi:hypothetical protein